MTGQDGDHACLPDCTEHLPASQHIWRDAQGSNHLRRSLAEATCAFDDFSYRSLRFGTSDYLVAMTLHRAFEKLIIQQWRICRLNPLGN